MSAAERQGDLGRTLSQAALSVELRVAERRVGKEKTAAHDPRRTTNRMAQSGVAGQPFAR
jgi:hypothetical protein